jgi:hypothetical protein
VATHRTSKSILTSHPTVKRSKFGLVLNRAKREHDPVISFFVAVGGMEHAGASLAALGPSCLYDTVIWAEDLPKRALM